MVASQKTIHRDLKRRLISAGVIPLERLSLRYIRAVACVTGAPVLGHSALRVMLTPAVAEGSATERFGTLKSVCVRRIGAKKYLQLVGQQQVKRPISTLVLRSRCSHALRELEETCRGVLRAVPRLFREPFILPGAGEAEIRAAAQLRGLRPQTAGAQVLAAAIREIGEAAGQTCAGGRSQEEVWDIANWRVVHFRSR